MEEIINDLNKQARDMLRRVDDDEETRDGKRRKLSKHEARVKAESKA